MFRTLAYSSFLVVVFLVVGCKKESPVPESQAPDVVVDTAIERDVQQFIDTTGYAAAYEFVNIPARVGGFLREMKYEPGDLVHAGAPLFLIEPDQYQASVDAAEASLASAKAQLELAEANLARTKQLQTQGATTVEDLQTDQAKRNVAAAKVLEEEASVTEAKLKLSYTDVRSPIFGKTDKNLVDIGNMVGADGSNTTLTSVAGMDPIYIYFEVSDSQFNHVREVSDKNQTADSKIILAKLKQLKEARQKQSGKTPPPGITLPPEKAPEKTATQPAEQSLEDTAIKPIPFFVGLIKGSAPNTGEYPFQGILDMASNKIDKSTGTIQIRGEIPNETYEIYPGQICRVRIPTFKQPGAVLVKEEAIASDLNNKYLFVVDDKNTAHRRSVVLGALQSDNMRVIENGITKGERYVSVGIQKTHDGGTVNPKPAPVVTESKAEVKSETAAKTETATKPETSVKPESTAAAEAFKPADPVKPADAPKAEAPQAAPPAKVDEPAKADAK